MLVDAQVDEPQAKFYRPDFDLLDVPRDRFLVAGDAWAACRTGGADPMTFGVGGTENWGLVEVLGDLLLDLAALQNIELLPWGWYGLAEEERSRRERSGIDRRAGAAFEQRRTPVRSTNCGGWSRPMLGWLCRRRRWLRLRLAERGSA